jgi:hypothetical protein
MEKNFTEYTKKRNFIKNDLERYETIINYNLNGDYKTLENKQNQTYLMEIIENAKEIIFSNNSRDLKNNIKSAIDIISKISKLEFEIEKRLLKKFYKNKLE